MVALTLSLFGRAPVLLALLVLLAGFVFPALCAFSAARADTASGLHAPGNALARSSRPSPQKILEDYERLRAAVSNLGIEGLLPDAQALLEDPRLHAAVEGTAKGVLARIGEKPKGAGRKRARYFLFASLSLPRGVVVRMLDEARARGDMEVLFRGVPEGETISGFARRLISTESEEAVPLAIDPVPFRTHAITSVPAILDNETGHVLHGTFFAERFEHHAPGETVDRIYEVAEPDLIKVMQARAGEIDWAAKREGALARAWARRPKIHLPVAEGRTERRLDLSHVLTRDLHGADGVLIASAGTIVDPGAHLPFTPTLIVFDGRNADQIAYAAQQAERAVEPVLLTTDLGDGAGLEGLRQLSGQFGQPVYVLDRQIARRFHIRATPSLVRAGEGGGVVLIEGMGP
ncbi:MAG: TrbC family F-type conjugative pilus assembly protein [Pseudomonadota bacterium]